MSHLIALVVSAWGLSASVQGQLAQDDVVRALDFTRSPDGRLGITVPTRGQRTDHLPDSNRLNKLVEIATGRILAVIDADTGNEHMNHGDAHVRWAADGSGVFWHVSGKWGPRTMNYLRVSKDRVIWQSNLTSASRQEILRRVRQAAPQTYAAAVRRNHGEDDPLKGFTMDVELEHKTDYQLPLRFYIGLTSEPRGFGPLRVPAEAAVIARLVGVLGTDGSIQWSEFKILTRRQALRRESFLEGDENLDPEITQAIRQRIEAASPAAMKIIARHDEGPPPANPLLRIEHAWVDNMPFSLGGKILMLATADSKSCPNYPEGEAVVALPGVFGEDGTVKWSEAKVVTGKRAARQIEAVQQLKLHQSLQAEVLRRMAVEAPQALEAFQRAAASIRESLPENERRRILTSSPLVCIDDGWTTGESVHSPHPAELPYAFRVKAGPGRVGFTEHEWPVEARFNAIIEGVVNEDGSLTWGKFTVLTGADAKPLL